MDRDMSQAYPKFVMTSLIKIILSLSALPGVILSNDYACGSEPGWFLREDPQRCYFVSEVGALYDKDQAMAECGARGANLTCISSPEEMEFVRNVVFGWYTSYEDQFWIDLYNPTPSSDPDENVRRQGWLWGDGSPYSQYNTWKNGDPQVQEAVVRMNWGIWQGTNDVELYRYMCEKDPDRTTTRVNTFTKGSAVNLIGDVSFTETTIMPSVLRCAALCSKKEHCGHFQYDEIGSMCDMRCNGLATIGESYIKQSF